MTLDVDTPVRQIATGRSWRDLPPHPPLTARPLPVRAEPVSEARSPRSVNWRLVVVVAAVLVAGVALGVWSPWTSRGSGEETAAPIESDAIDRLPDTITPVIPDDLFDQTPPSTQAPEAPAPESPNPRDFFTDPPGAGGTPFGDGFPGSIVEGITLVEINEVPDGYRILGSFTSQVGDDIRQVIRLIGPDGLVTVIARNRVDVLPDVGEPATVGGADARIETGPTIRLSTLIGEILVTVEAPAEVGVEALTAIAEAVEPTS